MYVSTATAGEIAITAAEGGIGYWSQIDSYKWTRWTLEDGEPIPVDRDFVFYRLREDLDDDGSYRGSLLEVTPEVIQRGVNLLLPPNGGPLPYGFDITDLAGSVDSVAADMIIQLGLFGKIIYG